ncbi:ATPase [Vibrio owensii]|uniref:ATPase n=1 Tax=Vibrio owensii TaxID=696485 RepID=UPI00390A3D07
MTKWTLVWLLLPFSAFAGLKCDHASWNDNLTQFNRLESNYNQYVETFNALLTEHKQRQLLSQTFSLHELTLLWRAQNNQRAFQDQLKASIQYHEELTNKAKALAKLSKESIWMANGWRKLAEMCEVSDEKANQITAEWYQVNASQLAKDYTQLETQYLGLARLYDREANALRFAQNSPQ